LWKYALINHSSEIFGSVVRHPSFDPNHSFADVDTFPDVDELLPLHQACMSCMRCIHASKTEAESQLVAKIKILLDEGADPLREDAFNSPLKCMKFFLKIEKEAEKAQLCQKLIDMMEEKIAAGK